MSGVITRTRFAIEMAAVHQQPHAQAQAVTLVVLALFKFFLTECFVAPNIKA
jgi:hypothetical protein